MHNKIDNVFETAEIELNNYHHSRNVDKREISNHKIRYITSMLSLKHYFVKKTLISIDDYDFKIEIDHKLQESFENLVISLTEKDEKISNLKTYFEIKWSNAATKAVFQVAEDIICKFHNCKDDTTRDMYEYDYYSIMISLQKMYVNKALSGKDNYKSTELEEKLNSLFTKNVMKVFDKYDPKEGKLEHYFNKLWKQRINIFDKLYKKSKIEASLSQDIENEEGNSLTLADLINCKEDRKYRSDNSDDLMLSYYLIIKAHQKLIVILEAKNTKKENAVKKRWDRQLYTEMVSGIIKNVLYEYNFPDSGEETFDSMEKSFLDFYMIEGSCCRTLPSLQETACKTYKDFNITMKDSKGNSVSEREIDFPLHTKIWCTYYKDYYGIVKNVKQDLSKYKKLFYGYIIETVPGFKELTNNALKEEKRGRKASKSI